MLVYIACSYRCRCSSNERQTMPCMLRWCHTSDSIYALSTMCMHRMIWLLTLVICIVLLNLVSAACRGPYMELLHKLADTHMRLLPNSATSFGKEQDRELILRFFAMHNSLQNFKPPLSRFLNTEICQHQHMDAQKSEDYTKLFARTFRLVSVYGSVRCRCIAELQCLTACAKRTNQLPSQCDPNSRDTRWAYQTAAGCENLWRKCVPKMGWQEVHWCGCGHNSVGHDHVGAG